MAKRKQKKHHTTKRRRSMSGIGGSSTLMIVAGIAAGAVGARMLEKSVGEKVSPKVLNAGLVAAGAMAPKFSKSPLVMGIGYGFIATGAVGLLTDFGVLKGIDDLSTPIGYIDENGNIAGIGYDPTLSGVDPTLAGMGSDDYMGDLD